MNISNVDKLLIEAWKFRRKEDFRTADQLVQQALDQTSDNDYMSLGRAYHILAQLEADNKKYEPAIELFQKSLSFYEKAHSDEKVAHAMRHLADTLVTVDDLEQAESLYEKSLALYRENESVSDGELANALRSYSILLEKSDQEDKALDTWQEVLTIYQKYSISAGIDEAESRISQLSE